MDIWINLEINEGQPYPSTHLTEHGALLAQCEDILDFLGWGQNIDVSSVDEWRQLLENWGIDDSHEVLWDYDIENWKDADLGDMRIFRNLIVELTWDSGCVDYTIERTKVQP